MYVSSGGAAENIVENGGYVWIGDYANVSFSPNAVSGLILEEWNSASVHSGTTAVSPTVNSGCRLDIYSGGTATDIIWTPCVGSVTIEDGATVTYASEDRKSVV